MTVAILLLANTGKCWPRCHVCGHAHHHGLAQYHITVGINFCGWENFVTAKSTTKITKISTPRKLPAIRYSSITCYLSKFLPAWLSNKEDCEWDRARVSIILSLVQCHAPGLVAVTKLKPQKLIWGHFWTFHENYPPYGMSNMPSAGYLNSVVLLLVNTGKCCPRCHDVFGHAHHHGINRRH